MPARTNGSVTTATTTKPKRFELPALDFKFGSLTEGTNIPPPLPSPIEEEPSELKSNKENKPSATTTSSKTTNGAQPSADDAPSAPSAPSASSPARTLVRKRPADDIPASPTLSSRPGSIRRLFSRNLLNTAYANAEGNEGQLATSNSTATVAGSIMRPESRSDGSILDERRARRSSGWFRRLRGGGTGDSLASSNASIVGGAPSSPLSKRSSVLFADVKKQQQQQQPAKPAGPPPPMIPELGELEAKVDLDEGSLGGDLFKNIK